MGFSTHLELLAQLAEFLVVWGRSVLLVLLTSHDMSPAALQAVLASCPRAQCSTSNSKPQATESKHSTSGLRVPDATTLQAENPFMVFRLEPESPAICSAKSGCPKSGPRGWRWPQPAALPRSVSVFAPAVERQTSYSEDDCSVAPLHEESTA